MHTTDEYPNEVNKRSLSAIWQHYYKNTESQEDLDEAPPEPPKKRFRRVTKKEIIVRTLKNERPEGQAVSLQELSLMTGLTPHDLSGHLVHLINEGKVIRLGRGLFALATKPKPGMSTKEELKNLVEGLQKQFDVEGKVTITNKDYSESRRMMLDFLNDALLMCAEVEVSIKCKKDETGKGGRLFIELKAH